jgi:hypothetical protein
MVIIQYYRLSHPEKARPKTSRLPPVVKSHLTASTATQDSIAIHFQDLRLVPSISLCQLITLFSPSFLIRCYGMPSIRVILSGRGPCSFCNHLRFLESRFNRLSLAILSLNLCRFRAIFSQRACYFRPIVVFLPVNYLLFST